MKTKTLAYACLACAAASTSAAAAPCYSDGDVVTLAGTVLRKNAPAAAAQNVLVLSLAAPICVGGTPNARGGQATVKELQIVGSTPDPDTTVQLTGKLVTGNVSGFYSVPTAIWVLRSRPLTSR
jgi:hypothetical protein